MTEGSKHMQGDKCGIYGANCTRWVVSMQACNAHGLYCVPLYDTLGKLRAISFTRLSSSKINTEK